MAKFDLLTLLTLNASGFEKGINRAKKSSQEFKSGMQTVSTGVKAAFGTMFAVIGGGLTVVEGFKKSIGATQGTADAFEKTLGQMGTAADMFFKTLSSGDWSNFLQNMTAALKAGGEYAEVLDEIGDRQRSVDIYTKEEQVKLAGFEEQFRDTSLSPEQRQKALNSYKDLKLRILTAQRQINQEVLDAEENKYSTLAQLDKDYIMYVISNYDREIENIRKANENIKRLNEIRNASTTQSSGMYSYSIKDPNAAKNEAAFMASLTKNEREWMQLMSSYNKLNDEELNKIKNARIAQLDIDIEIASIGKEVIRQQNSINTATEQERKEREKINALINKQKQAEAELSRQKGELSGFKPMESLTSSGVVGGDLAPDFSKLSTDTANEVVSGNQRMSDSYFSLGNAISSVSNSMMQMLEDGKVTGGEFAAFMSQVFAQIVTVMEEAAVASLTAKMGETTGVVAMEGTQAEAAIASKSIQKGGWAGLALAVAGIAAVAALFASIKGNMNKYAAGGIIPGFSVAGDNVPVLANSKEMIINQQQQARLWDFISTGGSGRGGNVTFKVQGTELVGVLNNMDKKYGKLI